MGLGWWLLLSVVSLIVGSCFALLPLGSGRAVGPAAVVMGVVVCALLLTVSCTACMWLAAATGPLLWPALQAGFVLPCLMVTPVRVEVTIHVVADGGPGCTSSCVAADQHLQEPGRSYAAVPIERNSYASCLFVSAPTHHSGADTGTPPLAPSAHPRASGLSIYSPPVHIPRQCHYPPQPDPTRR
jgi:hypothetical protein